MKLYLCRHGMEAGGETNVHGFMDIPLTDQGVEQARALAESMTGFGITRIYSSDLTRTMHSAQPLSLALGIGIQADERLRPIKLGEYEGKPVEAVTQDLRNWQEKWMANPEIAIPDGDSFTSFQDRNLSFFRELTGIVDNDEPVAVFTHSRNCHLMQQWAANDMTPLKKGTEDILHHCDHELGKFKMYQIDKTSNLTRLTNQGQRGKSRLIYFIEPGLVHYEDVGTVMVDKPALDKMAPTFVGKPVFSKRHKETTNKDFTKGLADGIITRCYWDGDKAKYAAEALIWDEETLSDIDKGYLPSCAYDVTDFKGDKGKHNNVPYEDEVLNGSYNHMAIVPNPRYERVSIIANQGGNMKLMFWKKDQKPEEKPSEVELTNSSTVEVEPGKQDTLENVIAGYKAEEARKAELANAAPKIEMDTLIDVDGKKVSLEKILEGHKAHLANQAANSMNADHEAGKHKEKKLEGCHRCSNELANAKVAEEKAAAEKKAETERQNALTEEQRLKDLRERANAGQRPVMPDAPEDQDSRIAAGADRYGPIAN